MSKESKDGCPICEEPGGRCSCHPLFCGVCGQAVSWFGANSGVYPCKHVAAWGTVGEPVIWEDAEVEAKFNTFSAGHGEDDNEGSGFMTEEDAIEAFALEAGLLYEIHDDGIGHGHSTGTWVLFK